MIIDVRSCRAEQMPPPSKYEDGPELFNTFSCVLCIWKHPEGLLLSRRGSVPNSMPHSFSNALSHADLPMRGKGMKRGRRKRRKRRTENALVKPSGLEIKFGCLHMRYCAGRHRYGHGKGLAENKMRSSGHHLGSYSNGTAASGSYN